MKITGKTYDALKFIAQVGLPAIGTLYFTLAGLWGLPAAEQVVGTVVATDTFLGVVLQISSANFNTGIGKGVLAVVDTPKGKTFSLEFEGDPEQEIVGKDKVIFEVKKVKQNA